jgi:hypothetical protein
LYTIGLIYVFAHCFYNFAYFITWYQTHSALGVLKNCFWLDGAYETLGGEALFIGLPYFIFLLQSSQIKNELKIDPSFKLNGFCHMM